MTAQSSRLFLFALAVSTLLFPLFTTATELSPLKVKCPLDGYKFDAYTVESTNNFGGQDRDLCTHALGQQPATVLVVICPRCGYSGLAQDFKGRISGALRKELREKLSPPTLPAASLEQKLILSTEKYRRADLCYRILKRPSLEHADLCLLGSWACRLTNPWSTENKREYDGLVEYLGLVDKHRNALPEMRPLLDAKVIVDSARAGKINRKKAPLCLFLAGGLYRSRGENILALPLLKEAGELTSDESLRQSVKLHTELIKEERYFQKMAVKYYLAALKDGTAPKNRIGSIHYLLGELHRRLEQPRKARTHFKKAMKDPSLSAEIKKWASERVQEK
jgi:tetratricopeptide (TPR) repeat protein